MPKQPLTIQGFHGGINLNTDPRDISNIESPSLQDVNINNIGKISTLGDVDIDNSTSNGLVILPNRGLFTMDSDFKLSSTPSSEVLGNETFIVAYDSTTNTFDIKDSNGWGTAKITNLDTTHPVFYVGDGNLRIGDGVLNNVGRWYGYISDERFNALNADSGAIGWREERQSITSPAVGRCLISTPFAGPDDTNTVNSTASEYVGNVADSSVDAVARNTAVNLRVGIQYTELLPNTASGWTGNDANLTDDTTHFPLIGDNNVKATSSASSVESYILEDSQSYTISEDNTFIMGVFITSAEYADLTRISITHFTSGDATYAVYRFAKEEIQPDCWNYLVCSASNIQLATSGLGDTYVKWLLQVRDSTSGAASPTFYVSGPIISKDVSLTGFQIGTYTFYHTYLYDDEKQESLPFLFENSDPVATNNVNKLRIVGAPVLLNFDLYVAPCSTGGSYDISRRIIGSRLYFKVQENDNYYLIGEIDFIDKGFKWLPDGDTVAYAMANTTNTSGTFLNKCAVIKGISPANVNGVDTFRTINGFSGKVKSIEAQYKTAVVHGRRSYIGNIKQDGKRHPDRILKSQINKFDVFPDNMGKIDVVVNDGESIVKLEAFADRLLQFKEKTMYVINIAENIEFLEDTYPSKGCLLDYHVVKTDFGIAWFNKFGVYFFNGRSVENLLEKNGVRLINESDWNTFLTSPFTDTTCDYNDAVDIYHDDDNGKIKQGVYVTRSDADTDIPTNSIVNAVVNDERFTLSSATINGSHSNQTLTFTDLDLLYSHIVYVPKQGQIFVTNQIGDMFIYDFVLKAWTKGIGKITQTASLLTNFVLNKNEEVVYLSNTDSDIHTWNPDSSASSNFIYKSKDIDFGQPAIRKKIYRVRISYKGDASLLNARYSINGDTDTLYNFCGTNADGTTTGVVNPSNALLPLLNKSSDVSLWYHAELKPATSSVANNIYSFQLHLDGTVGATFEINDITFIYRIKNVK